MRKSIICIALASAFILGGCSAIGSKEPAEIDLNDYIDYSVEGCSSMGVLTYEIRYDDIIDDFELEDVSEKKLEKKITGTWDKVNGISNGDTLTFKWDIDTDGIEEDYNVKFLDDDYEVIINGLDEMPVYDPFEYINITYSGMAPTGSASIEYVGVNPLMDVYYSMDKSYDLNNGDTITVTAYTYSDSTMEAYCQNNGYQLLSETKEYTVDGLDGYCDDITQLTDDIIDELCDQAEDAIEANLSLGDEETLNSLDYIGCYFLDRKDDDSWYSMNEVYLIFEVNVTNSIETVDFYTYVRFDNIILQADGTNEIYDIMSYYQPYGSTYDNNLIESGEYDWWGDTPYFSYTGYTSVNSLYNNAIRTNLEYYNINNDIPESYFEEDEDEEEDVDEDDTEDVAETPAEYDDTIDDGGAPEDPV